ncbi:primosomal protein N' [Skermania sp. ID1734]|nr:primosomal protein N' [Skermania sp. ID1734]TSD94615.1 primosomal protein N' [Skermania sp. ID1734]
MSGQIARVLPLLPLAHLDREFDYLIPPEFDEIAKPGVRVRVRFAGRLVDGFLLERVESSDHPGKLGKLDRVVSGEQVLTPEIAELARSVAARYAGTRADVLRLAIPPRHARVEAEERAAPVPIPEVQRDDGAWQRYQHGPAFVAALADGKAPRAVWQALPGEDWTLRLAELAATVVARGQTAVLVVPDARDLQRLAGACTQRVGAVVALAADLGPAVRYRRWLAALRGDAKVVVGTRSSVFAPVSNLGLTAIWDDGDDNHAEQRAPYPHAREVALLRAHESGAACVVAGYARTAEAQALVASGWAHDLVAPRATVRECAPKISAPGDSEQALDRDPNARMARLPHVGFVAARRVLAAGDPVLVQVPRAGYVPGLACASCRTQARCRRCNGPMAVAASQAMVCRWCGVTDPAYRCSACGGQRMRATAVGARRTAEELGRAFPGIQVVFSGGAEVLDAVKPGPKLVVSTVGAEPVALGGYGAALLVDGWTLLGRPDLRAAEEALRRWMAAAALVRPDGEVIVVADPGVPAVQALIRWDPVWHAELQLAERAEVRFPPAVRVAALDGSEEGIVSLLGLAQLPADTEQLGPVPLPASSPDDHEAVRLLLRVPRSAGSALARSLAAAQAARSARKIDAPVRVRIDPIDIG